MWVIMWWFSSFNDDRTFPHHRQGLYSVRADWLSWLGLTIGRKYGLHGCDDKFSHMIAEVCSSCMGLWCIARCPELWKLLLHSVQAQVASTLILQHVLCSSSWVADLNTLLQNLQGKLLCRTCSVSRWTMSSDSPAKVLPQVQQIIGTEFVWGLHSWRYRSRPLVNTNRQELQWKWGRSVSSRLLRYP